MKKLLAGCIGIGGFVVVAMWFAHEAIADESPAKSQVTLEALLKAQLESVEDTEVIVSRVVMPPHTELPKHWHPGEEFAYVLEGTTILRRDGKADLTVTEGQAIKISVREVHTAVTTDQGATILVFRVHERGQPERVLVD